MVDPERIRQDRSPCLYDSLETHTGSGLVVEEDFGRVKCDLSLFERESEGFGTLSR